MPTCSSCGRDLPDSSHFQRVQDAGGGFGFICRDCAREGKRPPVSEKPTRITRRPSTRILTDPSVTRADGKDTRALRKPKAVMAKEREQERAIFAKMGQVLKEVLASEALAEPPDDPRRTHPRRPVDMPVVFRFLRDERMYHGRMLDVSKGGCRFSTEQILMVGQVLYLTAGAADGPPAIETMAEVRRVIVADGGKEAGVRFIKRAGLDDTNRRRYIRHRAGYPVYYTREHTGLTCRGWVEDISRGGMRLLLEEEVEMGERLTVLVCPMRKDATPATPATGSGDGAEAPPDIRGVTEVVRVRHVGPGEYDVGCRFVQLRVGRRPT